jgi:hypothetical protein
MTRRLPDGALVPTRAIPVKVFEAVSIAAAADQISTAVEVEYVRQLRVFISSAGANVDVELQVSVDGDWFALASYAAGVTGPQQVVDLPGTRARLFAHNAGLTAQLVTASLVLGI